MKIGMVSDSLGHLSFDAMLGTAAKLGVQGVEINAVTLPITSRRPPVPTSW